MLIDLKSLGAGWQIPPAAQALHDFMSPNGWMPHIVEMLPAAGRVVNRIAGTPEELDDLYGRDVPTALGAPLYMPRGYSSGGLGRDWNGAFVRRAVAPSWDKDGPNERSLAIISGPNSSTAVACRDATGIVAYNRVTGEVGGGLAIWPSLPDNFIEQFLEAMTTNGSGRSDLFVIMSATARQEFYLDYKAYKVLAEAPGETGRILRECMERVYGVKITKKDRATGKTYEVDAHVNLDLGRATYLLIRAAGVPFDRVYFNSDCTRTTRNPDGTKKYASMRSLEEQHGKGTRDVAREPGMLIAGSVLHIG